MSSISFLRRFSGMVQPNVRSLFLSDCHLGSLASRPDLLERFLSSYVPENLYLVGDIFDGWALRRRWRWEPSYSRIVHTLLRWADRGIRVCYTPGNHDEFLHGFHRHFGFIEVVRETTHRTADGRRLLVLHGDQFDSGHGLPSWLYWIGGHGYDGLIWCNRLMRGVSERMRVPTVEVGLTFMQRFGFVQRFVERFEERVAAHALARTYDGIICGHIHVPQLRMIDGVLYANSGDWVESHSALVEDFDGKLRLVHAEDDRRRPRALPVVSSLNGVHDQRMVAELV